MADFPCDHFEFCGRTFPSRWAAQRHGRTCAILLRRTDGALREREPRGGHRGRPNAIPAPNLASRRVLSICPELRSQAEAANMAGVGNPAPRNARDNILLVGSLQDAQHAHYSADFPVCATPQDGVGGEIRAVGYRPMGDTEEAPEGEGLTTESVVKLGDDCIAFDSVTEEEISEASRELAIRISEKSGARVMNRFLRLVLSDKWSEAAKILLGDTGRPTVTVEELRENVLGCDALREQMASRGFRRRLVVNPSCPGSALEMYMRDPTEVVRRQLRVARGSCENFYFHPVAQVNRTGERVVGHPMSAAVAWSALPNVREAIMRDARNDVVWNASESFIALLQCYSDKSCMSLKSSALTFYPFHVSVMNFNTATTEAFIRNGDTVVAYLPVSSGWPEVREDHLDAAFTPSGEPLSSFVGPRDNAASRDGNGGSTTGRPPKADPLRPVESRDILVESLRLCLAPLREVAEAGIRFQDADGKWRRAHLVVASYTGDTPEIVCLTCIFSGFCPRCEIPKHRMSEPAATGNARSASVTSAALQRYRVERSTPTCRLAGERRAQAGPASSFLRERGLTSAMPYFADWPFSHLDPRLDCYRISRFDFLHNFPLGLQKQLITLLSERLKSKTLTSTAYLTKDGRPKPLGLVRGKILTALNNYLKQIERDFPAVGMHVDFSQGRPSAARDGLFSDAGMAAMLEAKDLNNVMQILPLLAALADRLCGGDPVVTPVFVSYVTLVRTVCRRGTDEKAFTASDLAEIEAMVAAFKVSALRVFRDFQPSGFCFPKWHAVEHLVDDIRDLGNCANFSTAPFETSHRVFKEKHRGTSRRKGSAIAETARRIELADALSDARNSGNSRHQSVMSWLVDGKKRTRWVHRVEGMQRSPQSSPSVPGREIRGAPCAEPPPEAGALSVQTPPSSSRAPTNSKEEAIAIDACVLAKVRERRLAFSFADLASAIEGIAADSVGDRKRAYDTAMELAGENLFIASVGGYTLAKKVADILVRTQWSPSDGRIVVEDAPEVARLRAAQTMRISMVKSAHVAGFPTPSISDLRGATVCVTDDGTRLLQKVRSTLAYSHRGDPLQESVLVEGQHQSSASGPASVDSGLGSPRDHGEKLEFWFAKVLAFIVVNGTYGGAAATHGWRRSTGSETSDEMAVVRYYEVIGTDDLDETDRALQCIKLKWAVHHPPAFGAGDPRGHDHPVVTGEPWIDVIPVSSIRGRVHVLPVPDARRIVRSTDDGSDAEDEESDGGATLPGTVVFSGSNSWKRRRFYANAYRDDPNDVMYNLVDIGKGKGTAS